MIFSINIDNIFNKVLVIEEIPPKLIIRMINDNDDRKYTQLR